MLLARGLGQMWLLPAVFFGLAAAALQMYRMALNRFSALAQRQRDDLLSEFCR